MARTQRLVLIDTHALIHRAYHALPPMSTKDGTPTNATYGFLLTLLKVFETLKPTHVAAAFDLPGDTFRHTAFAEYKAHRKPAADDLVSQFALVRQVVEAFNIPVVEKPGFEADDIIGTLAARFGPQIRTIIVTGDMDALQLVTDTTSVFTLRRGVTDTVTFTPDAVREKYGFAPAFVPDYKGLAGDPSDNIPGLAGVGQKTARELVSTWGSIEDIYKHLEELSPRVQKRLRGHKKDALFSRKLATIDTKVPLTFTLPAAELADYDTGEVVKCFEALEFKSLLNRLPKSSRGDIQPTLLLGSDTTKAAALQMPANYHLADSPGEQAKLRKRLVAADIIAFDTETDTLGARHSPIIGMSFALRQAQGKPVEAWYVPVTRDSLKAWKDILENPKLKKIGHNIKYDLTVVRQSGIELAPLTFDTMIASYLLASDSRQHNLDALALQELQHRTIPITDLIGTGKDVRRMSEVPLFEVARYAAEDADVTLRLWEKLAPRLKEAGLTRVFEELEMPLISVLATMEETGIELDVEELTILQKKVSKRLTTLTQKIWDSAGGTFNINSPQQLRGVLYERLRLPTVGLRRTQSGFSTAASELAKLRQSHPIIALIEEYRELSKLQSTYIETLPHLVDPATKRIHTSYNQAVAATGRLSSTDPNLQNIPVRTELGQEIRAAFVAARGFELIKADYSQLELRIAAHLSQDPKMIEAFRAGLDIHKATAAWVHGVALEEVSDQQRRSAKTLNFGVLYGMGPNNFARAAKISVEEARSFIDRYRTQYAGLTKFVSVTIEQAEELGYVETLFGRRRLVPEIQARSPELRAQAERIAFNFPIQGTESDILKKAMIELQVYLAKQYPKARLLLTVHDELVVEAPKKDVQAVGQAMKKIMEQTYTLDVPLVVDVGHGKNWRDIKPLSTAA